MSVFENEMPFNKIVRLLGGIQNKVWRIFNYWIEMACEKDDVSLVTELGSDETSRRNGHRYITVAVDLKERRVMLVVKTKNKECRNSQGNKRLFVVVS